MTYRIQINGNIHFRIKSQGILLLIFHMTKHICLGYRGYGCTDSSHSYVSRYLPSVLFLTLSNLMFIPAIGFAIHRHLYIEALVYFFNMFLKFMNCLWSFLYLSSYPLKFALVLK